VKTKAPGQLCLVPEPDEVDDEEPVDDVLVTEQKPKTGVAPPGQTEVWLPAPPGLDGESARAGRLARPPRSVALAARTVTTNSLNVSRSALAIALSFVSSTWLAFVHQGPITEVTAAADYSNRARGRHH
jgi:hypothetical protein